jgi:hypothetical protein
MAIETEGVRSVWTQKDEAILAELTERKARINEENRHRVITIARTFSPDSEGMADSLIANADALRAALAPFCHEGA